MTQRASGPFVFYEPSGRRWRKFRIIAQSAAALLTLALVLAMISIAINPQLPALEPAQVADAKAHGFSRNAAGAHAQFALHADLADPGSRRSADNRLSASTLAAAPLVFGYYVNWDPASIVSLRLNIVSLTHLLAEWLVLSNAQGDLDDTSDPSVIQLATEAKVPILAMVTNFRDGWQAHELHELLNDAEARRNLVDNIFGNLREHGFAGVNIDFEQLTAGDGELLVLLMRELRAKLEPGGFLVTQSVPPGDAAYDLERLAALNDYLLIMLYDEHGQSDPPGPIASRQWFADQLATITNRLPRSKTIIALGNYGYDWMSGATQASPVNFADVMATARASRATIVWDEATGTPMARYEVGAERHELWFLDAVTVLNQTRMVAKSGVRGVALWRLGAEDPAVWRALSTTSWPRDDYDVRQLAVLDADKTVRQSGEGEVLRVVARPKRGVRRVWLTESGDAAGRYEQLPSYYVIESSGSGAEKTLALTFDDGPDPRFTPKILDVLRARAVPATFFVVGLNAERCPGLLKRMYADGHEVGNHTYSHPDIGTTSLARTRLELNATQRIIQHTIGVSTILFRPPYRADSEPQTPEEIEPIWRAQEIGYVTIGERIDPRDWEPGITASAIVAEVLAERENGRIVLLHDGGGDRSATVTALPVVIDRLRADGYRFVPVSELIGKTRRDVMPIYSGRELPLAEMAGWVFVMMAWLGSGGAVLFVVVLALVGARTVIFGVLAVWQKRAAGRRWFDPAFRPPVSVVIPAHNEVLVIVETIQSILDAEYNDLEIIVIDDGSSDGTLDLVRRAFAQEPRVRAYAQRKAGKAVALNRAIRFAQHDIIVAIDADTRLRPGTIGTLARHFADPMIGAVSGNARVANRDSWITRFQSIEYVCAFNLDRRALDVLNAITVVPGAVGAWRKPLIEAAGGFSTDTLAEDTDLTLAIRRDGYRIRYDEAAVAYTVVPHDTRTLVKQRFRWLFGTLQAAWKHRAAIGRPRYGTLALVALPSLWLFQLILPLVAPAAEVMTLGALCAGNWPVVLAYLCLFFAVDLAGGLLAYALEGEKPSDLVLLFVQRLCYRPLFLYVSLKSLLCAVRGGWVEWSTMERRRAASRPRTLWLKPHSSG